MSLKSILALVCALSIGFTTTPVYAGEVIYCSSFESCPYGTMWNCASPGAGGSCVPEAWSPVGPGNSANALVVDPTNPNIVYASGTGMFKSIDGGDTWTTFGTAWNSFLSLAIKPDASVVYGGTLSSSVWNSSSHGANFSPCGALQLSDPVIYALATDPNSTGTVYAGTSDGLWKSTNSCVTSTPTFWATTPSIGDVRAIAVDASTLPTTVYISFTDSSGPDVARSQNIVNGGFDCNIPTNSAVDALLIDPAVPDIVYAGTLGAGIFKSTDQCDGWTSVNSGLDSLNVRALAITTPGTPSILYAGTSGGVFTSTDAGNSWTTANMGLTDTDVRDLVLAAATPARLFAATPSGVFRLILPAPDLVAEKTNNVGGLVATLIPWDWQVDVSNTGDKAAIFAKNQVIFQDFMPKKGMTYSGASVTNETGITGTGTVNCTLEKNVITCAASSSGTVIMNAVTSSFRVTTTATPLQTGIVQNPTGGGCSVDPVGVVAEHVETNNTCSDTVIVGVNELTAVKTNTVSGSTTLGNSWDWQIDVSNNGNRAATFESGQAIFRDTMPTNGMTYVGATVSNETGISGVGSISCERQTETIACVVADNGLSGVNFKTMAIDPVNTSTLYAAGFSFGVFKSIDSGSSWTTVNAGLTDLRVLGLAIDPIVSATVYAGSQNDGAFKSTDGGGSWMAINTGLTSNSVRSMAIDPFVPATLYAGTQAGVFKSTNGGGSWTAVNSGLTNINVIVVVIDPITSSTLYAGTLGGGVFKSTNGGTTWVAVNNGLAHLSLRSLAIDPITPATLYAGTFFSFGGSVFKSTNGGSTWTESNTGLFNITAETLVIDPSTPSTLYVDNSGVYKSTDSGTTWAAVNTGLTALSVKALGIDPSTPNTLYAATDSGGLFKSINGGGTWTSGVGTPGSGTVILAPTTGSFRVTTTATASTTGAKVNPTGGICLVDPDNNVDESNETNNACEDIVFVSQ